VLALIEIDCDGHCAGVRPDGAELLAIAVSLAAAGQLRGVLTYVGAAYDWFAERERRAVVTAAERLRAAGMPAPIVSVGSTPTAMFARDLTGVTEVRAGVYVFMDLVMVGLGVASLDDVALSVLTTVIGHQRDRGWLIVDAGWMALSRDRGTQAQANDRGFGLACDEHGTVIDGLIVVDTNQEHGVLARDRGAPVDCDRFPVGTRLRILPNHACATAGQHDTYQVVDGGNAVVARWPRFGGW
jgi:D-serine deaminase-like pyridoxal phosphate-dependent protein